MSTSTIRYIVGIEVNQTARGIIKKALADYPAALTLPIPLIIPLFDSAEKPSEPVGGLFPPCFHLSTSSRLEAKLPGPWLVWGVDNRHWLNDVKTVFHSMGWATEPEATLLPCMAGIPITVLEEGVTDVAGRVPGDERPWPVLDWKALKLICLELRFSAERPWYKSLIWCEHWKRSLRGTLSLKS